MSGTATLARGDPHDHRHHYGRRQPDGHGDTTNRRYPPAGSDGHSRASRGRLPARTLSGPTPPAYVDLSSLVTGLRNGWETPTTWAPTRRRRSQGGGKTLPVPKALRPQHRDTQKRPYLRQSQKGTSSRVVTRQQPHLTSKVAKQANDGFCYVLGVAHSLGYARISTLEQNTSLQTDALKTAGCYRIFTDKASGGREDRPQLIKVLDQLRPSDTLVVWPTASDVPFATSSTP